MPAYLIVNLSFRDLEWASDYLAHVPDMVRAHGGAYVARSKRVELIEGDGVAPDQTAILIFPSLDAIRDFMASPEYAPFRDARIAATRSHILAFET